MGLPTWPRMALGVGIVVGVAGCPGGAGEPRGAATAGAAIEPADAGVAAAAAVRPGVDAGIADAASGADAPPPPDLRAATLELAFAGDVMFGRYKRKGLLPIRAEQIDVWKYTRDLLDSDLTLVNLETPILRAPPKRSPYGTRLRFVATPARVATLRAANIDAVTLANNHADDMHAAGVAQTAAVLAEQGLHAVGAARAEPPLLRVETLAAAGWSIGFIAVTQLRNVAPRAGEPQVPYADQDALQAAIEPLVREARADHDLVIVVVHWGLEYEDEPRAWMVAAGRAWIDAGADAVIGHHPHVLQGIERHGDGVIAYSLGNLLFDNPHRKVVQTGVLRLRFRRDGTCLDEARLHPVKITGPQFAPRPAKPRDFRKISRRLRTLSTTAPLQTTWAVDGDALTVAGACPAGSEE